MSGETSGHMVGRLARLLESTRDKFDYVIILGGQDCGVRVVVLLTLLWTRYQRLVRASARGDF